MTVFTQNQTAIRLNARPSFMITDILAASNHRESSRSPPTHTPTDTMMGAASEHQHHHQRQLMAEQQLRGHLMAHPSLQQLHQQHHHHLSLMNAAKMMGVGGAVGVGPGGGPVGPAGMPMLGMMGKIGEMRVPAAGLSPTAGDDFDSDDNEEGFGDDADGDSSVCSNGTKDDDDQHHNSSGGSHSHGGGNPLSGMRPSSKKQRKARTAFSDHQLHSLEKSFTRQKYLSVQDRMELANKLGISDTQVKTWFQNRRTKWKRQTSVGFELLVEAGNYAAYQRAYRNYPQMDGGAGGPWSGYPGAAAAPSAAEIYYRQASLAALQGHNPYGMYAAAAALNNLPKPPTSGANTGFPMFAAPPTTTTSVSTTSPHQHHLPFAYPPGLARPTAHLPGQHPLHSNDRRSTSPASESTTPAEVGARQHHPDATIPISSQHDTPPSSQTDRQSPPPLPQVAGVAQDNGADDSDSDIEV